MNRDELTNYQYTKIWIKDQIKEMEEFKSNINKLVATISDMPKRI